MREGLSFDDVLLVPYFSNIKSREEVNTTVGLMGLVFLTPIISAPMDTVTGPELAAALYHAGGFGTLHRFSSIEQNVSDFKKVTEANAYCLVSVGITGNEMERFEALYAAGARHFIIDVAYAANMRVVEAFNHLSGKFPDAYIIPGNFATAENILAFKYHAKYKIPAVRVGIGGGSMCTTRIVTGVGIPTLQSIIDCVRECIPIIADGGIRNSGDMAKALGAGARLVMLGKLLAQTEEAPGTIVNGVKTFRGSASKESYEVQGKVANWRAPEGESTSVPVVGKVLDVVNNLTAGLKSSLSYQGYEKLSEFNGSAHFIRITSAGMTESKPHGKT